MDNFKSFNDFLKEQHEKSINTESKVPNKPIDPAPEFPEISVEKKKHKKHTYSMGSRKYLFFGIVVFIILMITVFFLPVPLGHISLKGTNVITLEDVIFEGEIREPVNVLQIDSSKLEYRLSKDIRVESVTVQRKFPFELVVNIQDRKPLGIVQYEFGYAFVDKNGIIMDTTHSIRAVDVPMITGEHMGNLLLGDSIDSGDLTHALDFLNNLSPEGLKVFSEINIGNPDNIKAYTRDGITVRLGDGMDIAKQAHLAENMVGDVKARGLSVEYIDANLNSPFIKLKK